MNKKITTERKQKSISTIGKIATILCRLEEYVSKLDTYDENEEESPTDCENMGIIDSEIESLFF